MITNNQIDNKRLEYESIFKHYGLEKHENEKNLKRYRENHYEILERNESNKKMINAKTITKKPEKKTKKKKGDKVIKIKVPEAAKARKTTYSGSKQQSSKNLKAAPLVPGILVHVPSNSTIKSAPKLPTFVSKTDQSTTNQILPLNQGGAGEPNPTTNSQAPGKDLTINKQSLENYEFPWDLDEINRFTREIFKNSLGKTKPIARSYRVRLKCAVDQDDYLKKYIQSRSHCLDVFDEHVTSLKRQHGIIRDAASDPPIFEPGISITGPQTKKDAADIDKEDSHVIKKLIDLEPRKKYALVHEQIGIFIIGGYNLFVNIPIQKEPVTDYLFKLNGDVVKIPPINPCRVHFGIFTDGDAIYIAGGQTIQNELLDDIQRLNLGTLKWEYVTTLMNPIAACGMTIDNNRIYLIGGYDMLHSQTVFLADYTIYNLSTRKYEKSTDLPSPRCRSLVFLTDHAVFCISGLIEIRDENNNKKLKISTDILKWTEELATWVKVSQTPELTKFHALSFNDPYLEITRRSVNDKVAEIETNTEAYYDFRKNIWTNGKVITPQISTPPIVKPKTLSPAPKSSSKSGVRSSPKKTKTKLVKTPSKIKSPSKTKDKKQERRKKKIK